MDPELRKAMTGAAVELCRKLGYLGAGTAEFILVRERKRMIVYEATFH